MVVTIVDELSFLFLKRFLFFKQNLEKSRLSVKKNEIRRKQGTHPSLEAKQPLSGQTQRQQESKKR